MRCRLPVFCAGLNVMKFRELHAGRDHFDRIAEQRDVGAVTRGLFAIDNNLPFDTWQRSAVLNVDKTAELFEQLPDLANGRCNPARVARRDLQLDGLALRHTLFLLANLDHDAGNAGGAIA